MTRQRLIKIAIAAAVLVTVAVVCVLLSFAFAFNQEAALCAYLDGCGISDEDLCDLIDDLVASKAVLDEDDEVSERGIDALWNAVSAVSSRGGQFVEAARAYENAPAAGNPRACGGQFAQAASRCRAYLRFAAAPAPAVPRRAPLAGRPALRPRRGTEVQGLVPPGDHFEMRSIK